ncbi:MAG: zinc ABC transporter substrate-binding protein [bacterium]|jgi:ABC-type Zn uptake system ZnuABC Zn-binding protein ZnuA
MKQLIRLLPILLLTLNVASAKLKVVASISDLAYFAELIGGDKIEVSRIASPRSDIHFIEVRPSYMVMVKNADIALKVGLELDIWMDRIIDGSRNGRLKIIDCSKYIEPLEVPSFRADARYGDLHRYGNPHYWLSPDNLPAIFRAVEEGLADSDPGNAAYYSANSQKFLSALKQSIDTLMPRLTALAGKEIIYYHNSWPYFNKFVGLSAAGFIEPYPGVPPSPSHMASLVKLIKEKNIRLIAMEPYFDKRVPEKIASETGARMVVLYPSIGGRQADESYIEWLSGNIDALLEALP